jgi:hypothetical protein
MVSAALIGAAASAAGTAATTAGSFAGLSAQQNAVQQGMAAEQSQYAQTQAALMPYQNLGLSAVPQLQGLTSGNPATLANTLQNLPGYQWDLSQGLQATQSSAAARGLGNSGAAMSGAATFANGLADNTLNSQYNRLLGLAGMGQSAATQTGQFGAQLAAQLANGYQALGGYQAQQDNLLGGSAASLFGALGNSLGGLFGG